ncbi:MAG: ArsR family transcriptional regulator [bacterium]|nr:ArsR family transcriptional regulator [bacterium]
MDEKIENFIESWGSMGVLWGINRSMARVHAFLMVADEPVDLDSIAVALNISKGNASMCLKDLRNWGLTHRVNISGDRRDFYVCEPDMWRMFYRIAVERKKREYDPSLESLKSLIEEGDLNEDSEVYSRLSQMEYLLSTLDRLLNKILEDEKKSKTMLEFFKNI